MNISTGGHLCYPAPSSFTFDVTTSKNEAERTNTGKRRWNKTRRDATGTRWIRETAAGNQIHGTVIKIKKKVPFSLAAVPDICIYIFHVCMYIASIRKRRSTSRASNCSTIHKYEIENRFHLTKLYIYYIRIRAYARTRARAFVCMRARTSL